MPANTILDRRTMIAMTAAALGGTVSGCSQQAKSSTAINTTHRRRFENKVVLITGATSGIGRAAAIAFAAEGAKVAFCGRRENLGREVEAEIKSQHGEACYIRADVRDESSVKTFVDHAVQHYGRLDVAFNNAGITLEKPLHEYTSAEWNNVLNTNLRGVFLAMKYEIPYMLGTGGGNIVVTSSSNAIATTEGRSAYTASKRGLVGLVQSAALDYVDKGIRINTLIPGTTDTALVRRVAHMENAPDVVWEAAQHQWAKAHVPMKRMATPQEIAAFALALASDDFPYMTGAQMVIDGGKTARAG
ncbi:MAG TPA: SDR family oxidoreductase [Acidobacteriaceae bacterium]|nr:SDR family oxidoreductase [Acidobacteriaceae bacterium]